MSWTRKMAAVLAAVQILAGSAAMLDVFGPVNGAKIAGALGALLGSAHAFLSAYRRPESDPVIDVDSDVYAATLKAMSDRTQRRRAESVVPGDIIPWTGPVPSEYAATLRALSEQAYRVAQMGATPPGAPDSGGAGAGAQDGSGRGGDQAGTADAGGMGAG